MQEDNHPKTFILPYIIDTSYGETRITLEEEIAAISCLAFHRRKKIGIISSRAEEIKAISKIYYPLVCLPWGQGCFITDGLEFLGFTFSDFVVPDLLQFLEGLRKSRFTLNNFIETLDYGTNLFSDIVKNGFGENRINCLIVDRDLLKMLLSLSDKLALADSVGEEKPELIRPKLQTNPVESISSISSRLKTEISMLRYTLKTLEDEVSRHLEMLSKESDLIVREYKRKISEFEAKINRRSKYLIEKKLKEINEVEKKYDKRIKDLLREREKVERILLKNKIFLEKRSRKGNEGKRKSIKGSRVDLYLLQIEDLAKRSKELRRAIEETEAEKNNRIQDIEEKYSMLIKNGIEKIDVLRESRDADIGRVNEDTEKIKKMYLTIKENIAQIINEKERLINALWESYLPINIRENAIIGLPFYMVIYEGRSERRLDFYPLVKVSGSIKAADNLFKLNLESRITLLLTPLKEPINVILNALVENYSRDPYLNGELRRIVEEKNILFSRTFIETLKSGLENLKHNGWLNSQEENTIVDFYESILKAQ
ncbi:MAG: hypothetical protein QXX56_05745 [Candidatus Bathyarchaeia archaeon]